MNIKMIGRFLSKLILIEAAFLLPALFISLGYGEAASVKGFLYTIAIILVLSGLM